MLGFVKAIVLAGGCGVKCGVVHASTGCGAPTYYLRSVGLRGPGSGDVGEETRAAKDLGVVLLDVVGVWRLHMKQPLARLDLGLIRLDEEIVPFITVYRVANRGSKTYCR